MKWAKQKQGFTIVELLIVIVVIAILAAVTIVAYTGIQNRAKNSGAQTAVSQAVKKIQLYAVDNAETFPATLNNVGLVDAGGTNYQYTVDNNASPRTYCLTVTYQNVSYYQNTTTATKPTAGACPGHGNNGLPPNLATNPSFETGSPAVTVRTNLVTNPSIETATTWGMANGGPGASNAVSTVRAHSGAQSLLHTFGDNATQDSGPVTGVSVNAGTAYTASVWVYSPSLVSDGLRLLVFGTPLGGTERGSVVTTVGSWARLSYTFTPSASGTVSFGVGKGSGTNDNGKTIYIDSALLEATNTVRDYFSGATASQDDISYAWSGTAHQSSSTMRVPGIANYAQNGTNSIRFQSGVRSSQGSYSARVMVLGVNTNPGLYQSIVLSPGTYTAAAKVWLEPGGNQNVAFTMQGTGVSVGQAPGAYPYQTTTQGDWVEIRRTFTVSSENNVNVFVYTPGNITLSGYSFWVDEFVIVRGECSATACY